MPSFPDLLSFLRLLLIPIVDRGVDQNAYKFSGRRGKLYIILKPIFYPEDI